MSARARVLAPAKINLFLRVLARRADGYHEIDTVFQAVDLCDEVEVALGGATVTLEVDGPHLGPTEENLAHRAAVHLTAELDVHSGVHVRLRKRIPVGAGLGGGSSDAAAVLRALAALLDVGDAELLRRIGAELGSDVPFFLGESPLARGRGRGERLVAMTPLPVADLVVVTPPVHVSTAGAYAALAEVRAGSPAGVGSEDRAGFDSWSEAGYAAHNDFQPVISAAHPEVGRALRALRRAGATFELMTGSGSSCFGLYPDPSSAGDAARRLAEELGWPCMTVRTLEAFPEPQLD